VRVAVTTAPDRAGAVTEVLEAAGLRAVLLPCIQVEAMSEEHIEPIRRRAVAADALILTSPRTVSILWPAGSMPRVPAFCVGPATAQAVERAGGVVGYVGRGGAADLAEDAPLDGLRVVFPHSAGTDLRVVDRIRSRVAGLEHTVVYHTRPRPPSHEPVDAVLFGSPSAVEGWLMGRSLDGIVVAAIGATTARHLTERGHRPHVTADPPDYREAARLLARRNHHGIPRP
jgi:uroporphyrinogen-III synthase